MNPRKSRFLRAASIGFGKGNLFNSIHDQFKLEKLKFSTDIIKFRCLGMQTQLLYNQKLKLTNETGTKIMFNIKSNNPDNYEVTPYRDTLQNGKQRVIRIRLNVNHRTIGKCNLDKFVVEWGKYEENSTTVYRQSVRLDVRVEFQNQNQGLHQRDQKQEEKDLKLLKELLKINKDKICRLDQSIQSQMNYQEPYLTTFLNRNILFLLCLLSFIMGYFIF